MTKRGTAVFRHIMISPELHTRLMDIGKKGESFDKIVSRLVEEHNIQKTLEEEIPTEDMME